MLSRLVTCLLLLNLTSASRAEVCSYDDALLDYLYDCQDEAGSRYQDYLRPPSSPFVITMTLVGILFWAILICVLTSCCLQLEVWCRQRRGDQSVEVV